MRKGSACVSLAILVGWSSSLSAQSVQTTVIQPEPAAALAAPAPYLTQAEREAIMEWTWRLRTAMVERELERSQVAPPGLPLRPGRESQVEELFDTETHPIPPTAFVFGRNNLNPRANMAGGSTLAEPAAANDGIHVFAAGNASHNEFSTNGAVTWTNVPVPAGPIPNTVNCCDWDVVHDRARGLTVASTLYRNSPTNTDSVIRIFVRRTVNTGVAPAFAANCTYIVNTVGTGLMDFPHLGLSNDFLYLATNEIGFGYAGGQAAVMRRINLDPNANGAGLYDCGAITTNTFIWPSAIEGQRVWRPVEGADDTMYWAHHVNATTLRIFSWSEALVAPTNVARALTASTFSGAGTGPDCRGGIQVPRRDWFGRVAAGIVGFNKSGAVGDGRVAWYWNVMPDAVHTQGHVHSAHFTVAGPLTLIAQTPLFNNGFCFGLPNISMNHRGDIGIACFAGGRAGGAGIGFPAGSAATPVYCIDDDFSGGIGFCPILTASTPPGTHNRDQSGFPLDDRAGDYFTIHPHSPCDYAFTATGYALIGTGTGSATLAMVNSRYVEFYRQRDAKCYLGWRNFVRVP
jgi:hypothetical protein